MNELWWRSSLDYFKKATPSKTVLRSATKGIINSKSVHTRVRTEVRHEVHVHTEVSRVVDKEEVHVRSVDKEDVRTRAVDEEDIREKAELLKTESMEGNWNDVSDNFHVNGLDHQPVEGVSQCTILNDEYESVVVDGLISLWSQDVGHISKNEKARDGPEFKVKENEEASHSDVEEPYFNNFVKNDLDDVHIDSVVKDAEEMRIHVKKFPVRVIKTVVGSDGNEIQLLPWKEDLTRSPTAPKRTVSVPEADMALFRDKNMMEMRWTFPWLDDGHLVQIEFWEKLVGRSHTKRGWLSSDVRTQMLTGQLQVHISVICFPGLSILFITLMV
ncbi:hypothetical protein Tco_0820963 [Tanacetum coccineum]|uniref:Uncharacterized protein n=1 Tax=Tanacetum coccineum TaxID=301880 RepID=A0ABQ5ACN1_9ASTR